MTGRGPINPLMTSMAETEHEQCGSSSTNPKEIDSVIFQVIVDDKETLSHGLEEFEFIPEDESKHII